MKSENILKKFKTECFFSAVFDEGVKNPGQQPYIDYPRKIVHARANYDRNQWDASFWTSHSELATPAIRHEIDKTYEVLISENGFKNLDTLCDYCSEHPEALANENTTDEYNFYFEGELCYYWLRCITRHKDYTMYLHAFLKSDDVFTKFLECLNAPQALKKLTWQGKMTYLKKKYPILETTCAIYIVKKWMENNGGDEK